jgi:hypothetical protein
MISVLRSLLSMRSLLGLRAPSMDEGIQAEEQVKVRDSPATLLVGYHMPRSGTGGASLGLAK